MATITELAKELNITEQDVRGWAQDLHDDEWTEPICERTGHVDSRTAAAIRKAAQEEQEEATANAIVSELTGPYKLERIEDGTLVEVHAGTFRAWLGTVRGASEVAGDGTNKILYCLERGNGTLDYATEDAVTIVPE